MGDTIKVTVQYHASEECQKLLIMQDKDGTRQQQIIIDMPKLVLNTLPVGIDTSGNLTLQLQEHHYQSGYQLSRLDGTWGGKCDCCNQRAHGAELSRPISTYDDVVALFADNQSRKDKVQAMVDARIRERELADNIRAEVTAELTAKMENKYQNSLDKINQIDILIRDKQRVRTAQIMAILES